MRHPRFSVGADIKSAPWDRRPGRQGLRHRRAV